MAAGGRTDHVGPRVGKTHLQPPPTHSPAIKPLHQPASPFDAVFDFMCKKVFDSVDANRNGVIEQSEVEVAILSLYNQVRKKRCGGKASALASYAFFATRRGLEVWGG